MRGQADLARGWMRKGGKRECPRTKKRVKVKTGQGPSGRSGGDAVDQGAQDEAELVGLPEVRAICASGSGGSAAEISMLLSANSNVLSRISNGLPTVILPPLFR